MLRFTVHQGNANTNHPNQLCEDYQNERIKKNHNEFSPHATYNAIIQILKKNAGKDMGKIHCWWECKLIHY